MNEQSDAAIVERLRAGDEDAFTRVFTDYHATLMRLTTGFVHSASIAEEVVQDTWIAVFDSLDSFEGRSTLKTWIVRIAINRAKTRAERDGRTESIEDDDGSIDSSRFSSWGAFKSKPDHWEETPEALVGQREVREAIDHGIETLPEQQRAVVTLRDIEGWSSEEVCNALSISESNQRVLLHRARLQLRAVLETTLRERKRP